MDKADKTAKYVRWAGHAGIKRQENVFFSTPPRVVIWKPLHFSVAHFPVSLAPSSSPFSPYLFHFSRLSHFLSHSLSALWYRAKLPLVQGLVPVDCSRSTGCRFDLTGEHFTASHFFVKHWTCQTNSGHHTPFWLTAATPLPSRKAATDRWDEEKGDLLALRWLRTRWLSDPITLYIEMQHKQSEQSCKEVKYWNFLWQNNLGQRHVE